MPLEIITPDPNALYDGHGTGALFREPSPADWDLSRLPEVREAVAAGLPDSFSLRDFSHGIYDQGALGACVDFSTAGAKSVEDQIDLGVWQTYDAMESWRNHGSTPAATTTVLGWARDTGFAVVGTQRRYKIASYMFAPQVAGQWRQTLCAALMASGPCLVATLLPDDLGWNSSGPFNQSRYHQMIHMAWEGLGDNDWAVFQNSWGPNFGDRGFVRLRWGFLESQNFQNRYAYGFQVADFIDGHVVPPPPPPPPPPPVKRYFLTGEALGASAPDIRQGQTIGLVGLDGALLVNTVRTEGGDITPPPPPPPPPPVGGLEITAWIQKVGPSRWLNALVKDAGTNAYVAASCDAVVGGISQGLRPTTPIGAGAYAARWPAGWPAGTAVTVTATAGTRTGEVKVAG